MLRRVSGAKILVAHAHGPAFYMILDLWFGLCVGVLVHQPHVVGLPKPMSMLAWALSPGGRRSLWIRNRSRREAAGEAAHQEFGFKTSFLRRGLGAPG